MNMLQVASIAIGTAVIVLLSFAMGVGTAMYFKKNSIDDYRKGRKDEAVQFNGYRK